jgi:hypothetical protein
VRRRREHDGLLHLGVEREEVLHGAAPSRCGTSELRAALPRPHRTPPRSAPPRPAPPRPAALAKPCGASVRASCGRWGPVGPASGRCRASGTAGRAAASGARSPQTSRPTTLGTCRGHICAGTWAHPAHIITGTGLAAAHMITGTGPTPPTSAPGPGLPLPRRMSSHAAGRRAGAHRYTSFGSCGSLCTTDPARPNRGTCRGGDSTVACTPRGAVLCRVRYRAVRDTVPCGIPCRVGYRATIPVTLHSTTAVPRRTSARFTGCASARRRCGKCARQSSPTTGSTCRARIVCMSVCDVCVRCLCAARAAPATRRGQRRALPAAGRAACAAA